MEPFVVSTRLARTHYRLDCLTGIHPGLAVPCQRKKNRAYARSLGQARACNDTSRQMRPRQRRSGRKSLESLPSVMPEQGGDRTPYRGNRETRNQQRTIGSTKHALTCPDSCELWAGLSRPLRHEYTKYTGGSRSHLSLQHCWCVAVKSEYATLVVSSPVIVDVIAPSDWLMTLMVITRWVGIGGVRGAASSILVQKGIPPMTVRPFFPRLYKVACKQWGI